MSTAVITPARHPAAALIAGQIDLPPGRQIPVERIPANTGGWLEVFRYADLPDWPHVIPDIAPEGHVILYALPGAGKSRLALAMAHCVAYLRPIAGYAPAEPGRAWYVDFENQAEGLTRASLSLDEWGSIETDRIGIDAAAEQRLVRVLEPFEGDTFGERLKELDEQLTVAAAAGELPRLVIVDTLQHMCFPYPDTNSQRWEKLCSGQLDALALKFRVCLLSVHHANKAGDLSGSTGLAGGATAVFKLLRTGGTTEGKLVCAGKNRAGRDTLCLSGTFIDGRWEFTDQLTAGQVATGGTQRRILDWLYASGPADVAAIRAGLPDVKPKTVSDLLSRLASKGYARRTADGVWACASRTDHAAMVRACDGCGRPMDVVTPGQTTHPNCTPRPRPTLAFGPGVPGDYWLDKRAAGVEDQADDGGTLAPVVELRPAVVEVEDEGDESCPVCGLLVLTDSPHGDCRDTGEAERRWPAQQELAKSIKANRWPRPVPFIAPEGDPRGQGDGRQHRGMAQWKAAVKADQMMTGYSSRWRPAALLGTYGPDRLVVTFDKTQAYVSACENVPVCPSLLDHHGPFDCDPRDLGTPNPKRSRGAEGMAGVVLVECPQWDHPELPHPLGLHAVPGEPMWIPSNMLQTLWNLGDMIARPVVLDSWLGPWHSTTFKQFAVAVKAARAAADHDSPLDASVKLGSSIAISRMRSPDKGKGVYRPDWHAAICAESMTRLWMVARKAIGDGAVLAGLGSTDESSWLVPEGADPDTWLPPGYRLGGSWGDYRRKPVSFRIGRPDLSGLDPARVSPSPTSERRVRVTGAIPLGLWVNRA